MSKLLVVFGATGQQGGSLVDYVINDPELSKQFKLRAVTRDPSKAAAQALKQKGVEVVKGDMGDKAELKQATQNAHTVFAVTFTIYDERLKEREVGAGKAMADAAVASGAQYLIWSTLPHAGRISSGKLQHMDSFDGKFEIEEYIRTLPIKSAFFAPGSFMQNFGTNMAIRPVGDGTFAISNFVRPETQLPLIDTVGDSGKYIGAILAEPDKYEGKTMWAATSLHSFKEIAEAMSSASGKTVQYMQLPEETWRASLPTYFARHLGEMYLWIQDYGYYGPQTKELVEWTGKQARGKLTTLEEYFSRFPPQLQ